MRTNTSFMTWQELVLTPLIQSSLILITLWVTYLIQHTMGLDLLLSIFVFFAILWIFTILFLRGLIYLFPFQEGKYKAFKSTQNYYIWSLYTYLYITHLFFLYRNLLIPSMFRKPFYKALGAKIAPGLIAINATITDPSLLQIGKNVIIGEDSLIAGHLILPNDRFILRSVIIHDDVLIGARSIILPGTVIGKEAVVKIGSVVSPNTRIGPREIWAGNPAQKVGTLDTPAGTQE